MTKNESKTIFEKSKPNRRGIKLPQTDFNIEELNNYIPQNILRANKAILPEVSELDAMRHYTGLSAKNFCIESGFYPLGSCTMKYNPKINDITSSLDGFSNIHPEQDDLSLQGALQLMYELQEQLKAITGMDAVSLQPAAGAHGELAGMLIVKKYFEKMNQPNRTKVIVPDSAHGTNPATAKMCGFDVVEIKSDECGLVSVEDLKANLDDSVAAIMMTNPNTLGLFEENILEISHIAHQAGALLYYDGANLNAIMGITSPAIMGFDIVHVNLHKTFSTPHGGGGPGSGPIGVNEKLAEFLPVPVIKHDGQKYYRHYDNKCTIGKVKGYLGNFGVLVRAYTYILMMGKDGLKQVSEDAVLSANYIKAKLSNLFDLPYKQTCMHEFVFSGDRQKERGANTLAIAKRLIDYGFHPPTVYFPLIVSEALMIEPTETESKETLDEFIEVMRKIAKEIEENPEEVLKSPQNTPVKKVDEALAARKPNLKWESE